MQSTRGRWPPVQSRSLKHPHVANQWLQLAFPEDNCQQVLEPPYDGMFAARLRYTYAVGSHDFMEAHKRQTVIVQSCPRAFQAHQEENSALSFMYEVAPDLQVFANHSGSWRSLKHGNTNRQR